MVEADSAAARLERAAQEDAAAAPDVEQSRQTRAQRTEHRLPRERVRVGSAVDGPRPATVRPPRDPVGHPVDPPLAAPLQQHVASDVNAVLSRAWPTRASGELAELLVDRCLDVQPGWQVSVRAIAARTTARRGGRARDRPPRRVLPPAHQLGPRPLPRRPRLGARGSARAARRATADRALRRSSTRTPG